MATPSRSATLIGSHLVARGGGGTSDFDRHLAGLQLGHRLVADLAGMLPVDELERFDRWSPQSMIWS